MTRRGRTESLVPGVCAALAKLVRRTSAADRLELPTTAALCQRFGVSRPVLREAISRLEMQGLIEVRHGVGLRVCNQLHRPIAASVSLRVPDVHERLHQTVEARMLVEVEIARLAATRIGDAELAALAEAQGQLMKAAPVALAIEADLRFHRILAAACGNQVLALMLESVTEFGRESRKRTIARAGVERAYTTHQDILDALRAHNAGQAAAAMRRHLETTLEDLQE